MRPCIGRLGLVFVTAWLLVPASARGEHLFRVSFDTGLNADRAVGRAEPWVSRDVDLVPGKFGKAARVGPRGQLVYGAEQNFLAGAGTLACWCRIPERVGRHDVQRLLFIQAKERGYWNYLATLEWQEGVFRAMVFDHYHGHGLHDAAGLPAFTPGQWHHVALVWDQAHGVQFYLDGKPAGGTWGKQTWWDRPTPHAIHLSYPGAEYDALYALDQPLRAAEVAALMQANPQEGVGPLRGDADRRPGQVGPPGVFGRDHLPTVDLAEKRPGPQALLRQARVRQAHDDNIPAWRTLDGRMNLFWPEWRAPVLGDVDYSGSRLRIDYEPRQALTHLLVRGLTGGCEIFGERPGGYVSEAPLLKAPNEAYSVAAVQLPADLTGLRVPRREGMKLHELLALEVDTRPQQAARPVMSTPMTGRVEPAPQSEWGKALRTRFLPDERHVLGRGPGPKQERHLVEACGRVHFVTDPVPAVTPLDAVQLRFSFTAPWKESVWWLRVQDPVNSQRDLMYVPVRVRNPNPDQRTVVNLVLDFWDVMLDEGTQLWIELHPHDGLQLHLDGGQTEVSLWPGDREKVLREFAFTQGQLAYSYWQLGSEMDGSRGAEAEKPSFALLGGITHNRELKTTLSWVRRHVPDDRLVNNLWRIIYERNLSAPVQPRLQPAGAPAWAVWGRELLERFRGMAHHWAARQAPDGQLGGGWNDDTDFPGVFLCLPFLGDEQTKAMFVRIWDGLEKTGYLHNGVSRAPIDALHATDFLSWRAHLMMIDYGQPRHVERALALTRELGKWTVLDAKGHRRFLSGFYSEDGPGFRPKTEVGDSGLIEETGADRADAAANRNFLREPIFCAWYSRNPAVLQFVREVAQGDLARAASGAKLSSYESYPFFSYFRLLGDPHYLEGPADPFLRDRWSMPIWRRYVEGRPNAARLDKQVLQAAKAKTASEEQLTAAYLATRDRAFLVRALRDACERLEGGWQFRGGEAGGANDHFHIMGQVALSQLYLGGPLTWLRPASILPPLAVSWEGLEDRVAALVLEASPKKLRVAAYNFDDAPRPVRMRVWELAAGTYRLREGSDADGDDRIDGPVSTRELPLDRGSVVQYILPPQKTFIIEYEQHTASPRPERLPDLALGVGDVFYDKATDRLKAVVHNLGSAAAENVTVRFEDASGTLLAEQVIPRLDAPLDLVPKTVTVWLPQPTLHPTPRIIVRIDPAGRVEEIARENNVGVWQR